jgi:hypothetical protein
MKEDEIVSRSEFIAIAAVLAVPFWLAGAIVVGWVNRRWGLDLAGCRELRIDQARCPHPKRRTLDGDRPDDTKAVVLSEADAVDNLPELPGFRCAAADLFA